MLFVLDDGNGDCFRLCAGFVRAGCRGFRRIRGNGDAELRYRASGRYRLSRRIGFESVQESFSGDWVLSVARMGEKLCRKASFQK